MKKAIAAGLLAGIGIFAATGEAEAATAWMGGTLGTQPGYATMTGPQGQKVNTGWFSKDTHITYDNVSTQSAKKNLDAWVDSHGLTGNTIWVYSLSSTAMVDHLNDPKYAGETNVYLAYGSPAKPFNGKNALEGGRPPTSNTNATVQFITVTTDGVALNNAPGTSTSGHINDYKNLNAQTQAPVSSTAVTPNVSDTVFTPQRVAGSKKPKPLVAAERSSTSVKVSKRAERKQARVERREARKAARDGQK